MVYRVTNLLFCDSQFLLVSVLPSDRDTAYERRPRFKTEADYRSFKFPQVKQEWIDTKNALLHLPFIGGIETKKCLRTAKFVNTGMKLSNC